MVLVPRGGTAVRAAVVVALDTPYVLRRSEARVKIATFGDNYAVMRNLVDLLLGRTTALRGGCRCRCAACPGPAVRRRPQNGWTRYAVPAPATRVSTSVDSFSPRSSSRLRSCSGTTSTPRFLIVSRPICRSRSAALSCFSR